MDGCLGCESRWNKDKGKVTISCWRDLESLDTWRNNATHKQAQELGKLKGYVPCRIRVCKAERDYEFNF